MYATWTSLAALVSVAAGVAVPVLETRQAGPQVNTTCALTNYQSVPVGPVAGMINKWKGQMGPVQQDKPSNGCGSIYCSCSANIGLCIDQGKNPSINEDSIAQAVSASFEACSMVVDQVDTGSKMGFHPFQIWEDGYNILVSGSNDCSC